MTGGVAAYKSVQLARDLTVLGSEVDVVATAGAGRFVSSLTFEAVTGRPVHADLFASAGPALHLRLAREADAVCVAPATADFLARTAHGRADDLLGATLLASEAPVLVCPAMNHRMWKHPQTRANVRHLRSAFGHLVAGPAVGPLAYGEEEGPGRLLEPGEIVEHVGRLLGRDPALEGRRVLVTAGPTREPLDPVRFLSNRSSGRMGYAVARAAWRRGSDVTLVSGPTSLPEPPGIDVVPVESAREMHEAVRERLPDADAAVFAAAVSDYRPARASDRKIKKGDTGASTTVELRANPDIAGETRDRRREGCVSVGFALETEELLANARSKLEAKDFDLLVANDPTEEGAGFAVETNRVVLLSRDGDEETLPLLSKDEVAERILDRIAERLEEGR